MLRSLYSTCISLCISLKTVKLCAGCCCCSKWYPAVRLWSLSLRSNNSSQDRVVRPSCQYDYFSHIPPPWLQPILRQQIAVYTHSYWLAGEGAVANMGVQRNSKGGNVEKKILFFIKCLQREGPKDRAPPPLFAYGRKSLEKKTTIFNMHTARTTLVLTFKILGPK